MNQNAPNPADKYVYLFVRQDLPIQHQIVQSNHATHMMASIRPEECVPNIVLIGVPDLNALLRVAQKLRANQIPHYEWVEPDFDLGFTSIATAPITGEKRQVLKNYRLYSPGTVAVNGVACIDQPIRAACLLTEDRGASARVAQQQEQPGLNGMAEG